MAQRPAEIAREVLQTLLPQAAIAIETLAPTRDSNWDYLHAQRLASDRCFGRVVSALAPDAQPELGRGSGGNRIWPAGTTGSITHKGTLVVAVAELSPPCRGLGVDLEHIGTGQLAEVADLLGAAIPPTFGDRNVDLTAVFAAKEAVYKAVPQQTQRETDFRAIDIRWKSFDNNDLRGTSVLKGQVYAIGVCVFLPWVLASARRIDEATK